MSSSTVRRLLRRHKPEKRHTPLKRRDLADLPFLERSFPLPRALLFDTTVYVDILQDHFPAIGEIAVRTADAWHSSVAEAELIALCRLLNPADARTRETTRQISAVIAGMPSHRIVAPDGEIWLEAGVLSGIIARLQGYGRLDRRRVLNDALIFSTARKFGMTVLTRNIAGFDLLLQLDPTGRVVFYESD